MWLTSSSLIKLSHLPSPATQWTATQHPGSSWNFFFRRLSQSSTSLLGGGAPSSNGQSWENWSRTHSSTWVMVKDVGVRFPVYSPPHWCHLSPMVLCHRWYHRPGQLWWLRNVSGPDRKRLNFFYWYNEHTGDHLCMFWEDTFIFLTSMKVLSVLSVGLCVIRNLMFLWHSSTGAGRFMVARGASDL